jgi:hypothetical protein
MAHIRVDDSHDRRRRGREAGDDGGAEAELSRPMHYFDAVPPREFIGERAGAVGRVVVDDDELAGDVFCGIRREDRFDELAEAIAFVVSRDDDRKCSRGGGSLSHVMGLARSWKPGTDNSAL